MKLHIDKDLNFGSTLGSSIMTMTEFTDGLCQAVYGKQILLLDCTLFLYSCLLSNRSVFLGGFFKCKIKSTLNVQRFQDIEDVQKNVTAGLKVYSEREIL